MTTMSKKMKEAGVPIPPVIQRIWQWVKDNGTHDANSVGDALGIPRNNASSTLGALCDRDMMTKKKDFDKSIGRDRFVYTVNPKLKKYELLPVTAESKNRPKRASAKKTASLIGLVQAGTANLPPVVPAAKPHILDTMPVREAYALYQELRAMFQIAT